MRLPPILLTLLLAAAAATPVAADTPPNTESVDGGALFQRTCAMCHGPDGRATTPMARKTGVKDLTSGELDEERIRTAILDGARNSRGIMPGYRNTFTPEQIDALVAHVQALRAGAAGAAR